MSKTKLIIGLFAYLLICLFSVSRVSASVLSIQTLPSYINSNNFKLSCTSDGGDVQFYVNKHGAGWVPFGASINTSVDPCVVQVDSTVVNDQTDYMFKANDTATTSTIYDTNGPGNVSGYYKDGLSDGARLHYHTPSDSDFDRVIIYRGDTPDFSADGSHQIASIGGSPNSDMTYEDHGGAGKYYDIRAVDHAGNSSGLVGDNSSSTTSTVTQGTPKPGTGSGKVTVLPKESGSVLGTEATPTPGTATATFEPTAAAGSQGSGIWTWIMGHKKISLGVLLGLGILGYIFYKLRK